MIWLWANVCPQPEHGGLPSYDLLHPLRDEVAGAAVAGLVEEVGAVAGLEVELEGAGAVGGGELHEPGGGIDRARGADRDEEVGPGEGVLDVVHPVGDLAEPDDVGSQLTHPASRARRQVGEVVVPADPAAAGPTQSRQELAVHVGDPPRAGP